MAWHRYLDTKKIGMEIFEELRNVVLEENGDHFIFSILLQHHFSKLSKYFRFNFLSVQVSEPYKAMLQT